VDIGLFDMEGNSIERIGDSQGTPLIDQKNFEPGATFKRNFVVRNLLSGKDDGVYCKVYLSGIDGVLAEVIQVTLTDYVEADSADDLDDLDPSQIYYQGTLANMTRDGTETIYQLLEPGEDKKFSIWFYFPETIGNAYNSSEEMSVSFDLCAEAVQSKNQETNNVLFG
jgi:hypothetical protein